MQAAGLRPVLGVLWMAGSGIFFVGVTGIVRWLGTDLPAAQNAFLRFVFGLLFMAPVLVKALRAGLAPGTLPMHLLRGMLHTLAVIFWFYAMARLPVAEVTAIGFVTPIAVTIGAVIVFGERITGWRVAAIALAGCGALVVLRPGLRELSGAHGAQLVAAVAFGASYLVAKRLTSRAEPAVVVAMMSLIVAVGLAPLAALVWVPPTRIELMALAVTAAFATLGHYCMTRAFAAAPLGVTQPVTFLQLVWASLLGMIAFGEPVDPMVVLGGLLIVGAVTMVTWREAHKGAPETGP